MLESSEGLDILLVGSAGNLGRSDVLEIAFVPALKVLFGISSCHYSRLLISAVLYSDSMEYSFRYRLLCSL